MNEWFILAFFMIVVGIPVIFGVGGQAFKRWLRHKETMATTINAQAAEKAAQYAAHDERLEQRVRVLERIVTDKGIAVADEIERLRDDHQLN
ncbi:MAG: hypothetical protein P0Y64_15990 [Candidatus Sphingomonas colombiensis]|nr:hypothetical protein [Sphingomonas sp.]WEK42831.1 MAG: hypothetical protein P0Y64_15990 [Sphingomonas sp.]